MKKLTLPRLKKKLDRIFSQYIRLRDATDGYCNCVTCGKLMHWKYEAEAGHYMHGLDYVEDNQHPQCTRCNKYLHGEQAAYTLFMIDRYGRERVDELHYLKGQVHKYSRSDIERMIENYKEKVDERN